MLRPAQVWVLVEQARRLGAGLFDELDAPVLRVTGADVPMPYNKHLERAAKVSAEKIVAAARRVLYLD